MFVSWWSSNHLNLPVKEYTSIYAALGITQIVLGAISATAVLLCGLGVAKYMHDAALTNVLSAPMSFFDTTPLGRIVNRFSADLSLIDGSLFDSIFQFSSTLLQIVATMVLVSIYFPVFIAPLGPLFALFWYIQRYYRASAREIKRLDSISRSPAFIHIAESLHGISTIRAFKEEARFGTEAERFFDENSQTHLFTLIVLRWLGVRVEVSNLLGY